MEHRDVLKLAVSPEGKLYIDGEVVSSLWSLLLDLALNPEDHTLAPELRYWLRLALLFLSKVREASDPDLESALKFANLKLSDSEIDEFFRLAPQIKGIEYLTADTITSAWAQLGVNFAERLTLEGLSVDRYLKEHSQLWGIVGRVFFHLAENKQDPRRPFAFLATYTAKVSEHGKLQHVPLGRALEEGGQKGDRATLLAILLPVNKAAAESALIKSLVDSHEIYAPQAWSEDDAYRFLKDIPIYERYGIGVRVPNWWHAKRARAPVLQMTVGEKRSGELGLDSILDFSVECMLDGKSLTEVELRELLNGSEGLVRFKGDWVEVDRNKIESLVEQLKSLNNRDNLTLAEGLRLLAGASIDGAAGSNGAVKGAGGREDESLVVRAGGWLSEVLSGLKNPDALKESAIVGLQATLRPYQEAGVRWLRYLYALGLGGCLADDMGLGKTLQIIAFILILKDEGRLKAPVFLVVPASLIGNWKGEVSRFAPQLKLFVAHASESSSDAVTAEASGAFKGWDIVLTTYSALNNQSWARDIDWSLTVLDEAQAIKNSNTKQTKAVKGLKASVRVAMTGTPVENQLGDLWSLFDFINPGLLGSAQQFSKFIKQDAAAADSRSYANLRALIQPYMLRRLKTDKRIISDLPDKTEVNVYCGLTARQIALYQDGIKQLEKAIEGSKQGIERKGIILSFLLRFKQICNHPAQWLGHGDYKIEESGKLNRLIEICDDIVSRQEKVLIFSQFRELLDPLYELLLERTGRNGFVLHGSTPIKERQRLVRDFQSSPGAAFFLLSLKAGGTGLNLTAASHVVHFDRWWNPAVENQATDRAFRIGQKRNVLVHKFIVRGTIEEKIDELILKKRELSTTVLSDSGESLLTEMSDDELISFVSLDISKVGVG